MSSWKIKLLKVLKSQSNQSCVNRTESGQSVLGTLRFVFLSPLLYFFLNGKCAKTFIRLHYKSVYLKELHNSDTTTKNTNLACENICFSWLFAAGNVSRGGTSAARRNECSRRLEYYNRQHTEPYIQHTGAKGSEMIALNGRMFSTA